MKLYAAKISRQGAKILRKGAKGLFEVHSSLQRHVEVSKIALVTENEIAAVVVDNAIKLHMALGPGLLESVYEQALCHDLQKRGLKVRTQAPIPVVDDGVPLGVGFRADLLVQNKVIVENKSVESVHPVAYKILLTYLKVADLKLGLLFNFGEELLKKGTRRVVNNF